MRIRRIHPEIIILGSIALITRLWGVLAPNAVVFDEVYFKAFAGSYLTGTYFFDIHPPLGKLVLAGWAWITSQDPAMLISTTSAAPLMRVIPALAGAALILVFYAFIRQLGGSRRTATFAGILLLLENALLVESRFVLIDSMLLLFGLSAITLYLAARRPQSHMRALKLTSALILAGMAASTKWTGLTALGLIGLIYLYDQIRYLVDYRRISRGMILQLVAIILIPTTIYITSFYLHFGLLTKSGPGDVFMSQRFQSTLTGNAYYALNAVMSFQDKFIELNRVMLSSEESLKSATHPYSSKWYTWPFMTRGVYYWQGDTLQDGKQGNIYLLGNPIIWWGIVVGLTVWLATRIGRRPVTLQAFAIGVLLTGIFINFIPFSQIVRVMFIYHYFFALIFSLALVVILLSNAAGWNNASKHFWSFPSKASRNFYIAIIILAFAGFSFFAPLSYGTPLSQTQLQHRMWLGSWR